MTKTRRIIHHACWFALLGPHAGVPVAIIGEALADSYTTGQLLLQILNVLPLFIAFTWVSGGLAALLTGMATACLPERIYRCHWLRSLACGALGSAIASLCWLLILRELTHDFFWMSTGPGLLAGLIMGWVVPYLPFPGTRHDKDVVQPGITG